MNFSASSPLRLTEFYWRGIILALSVSVILFSLWCLSQGITTIFMHLYYFPIVLLAYRYRWKGCGLATLLALAYLGLVIVFDTGEPDLILGALYRSFVFVGIAAVIAYLSERLYQARISRQQSTELREKYLSLAPAIILALDRNGAITFLNRKGGEILECRPDEVIGKSWAEEFLPEKDRERVNRVFSRIMAGDIESNRVFENPVLTCTGAEKIIRWNNTVLHDESGSITGVLGFGEDITEEKWAQNALREMQQFQESVIANANVWISVLDPDGTLLVWNDAAEAISGYKKTGVLGKNTIWKQLYPDKDYRKKVTAEIKGIIGRDTYLENFETEIRCADGTRKSIVWNTRGQRDNSGTVTSYIAIGRDVTAQKSAEFRAGESARFLATMIDTLPMPIFFKDVDGKYLGCNPPFEEYIGIKRDDLIGKTAYDISPEDLADAYTAADRQVFENPVPQRYETQVQYADGSRHDVIFYKAPFFNKDGSVGGLIGAFLDISERKRMEDALQQSELFNRGLVENLPEYLCVYGLDGRILYVNPASAKALGYDADTLAGTHVLSYIAEEYRDTVKDKIAARLEGDRSSYEIELVSKDGIRRSVLVKATAIQYRNNPAILLLLIDITERKKVEMAMKESEEKYRAFFTTSRDCVFITSLDGRWEDFNDAAVELFGYNSREDLFRTDISLMYANPGDRDAHIRIIREKGHSFEFPVDLRKKDGTVINALITTVTRKDASGNTIGFQGSIRDITEIKVTQDRIEKLLRVQEDQLRIINTSPAIAFLWRAEENWPIEMVSRNISQFGYSAEDFVSGRIAYSSIIHPDDLERVSAEVESNTRNTIDDFGQIYRIFGKDGSERWIDDYTHIRRDSSGNPTHYEGLILDITDRKKAENALVLESQRMESLLALSQMSQKADAGIISEVVEDAIRLTGSTIGYLATLNDDESVMTMKYWSKSAHVSCSIIDKPIVYDVEKTGLWGEAVRQRTSVITNDYTADSPFKRGTPKGHVPLVRHMNIPVFDGDHIVAVAGVGNKGTDYNEGDVRQLQLLMQGWWQIVIRKRAEDALQNSEGRLRTLLQTIPDLIWLKDAEGAYLSCNSMFERFFGAKEADIVGKTDYDFVDHKLADFFRENDRKAMAASGPTSNEEWITFADDGHRALLDTIKAPVYDEQKSLIGILGIGRDITDRKHAEEERDKVRRWQAGVNHILESVLSSLSLEEKLKVITDGVVDIFGADFCRIWLIDRGDRCDAGCMHAGVIQGPHVCRFRDKCLHLRASSGRYTHLDGKGHGRVPFGAYKIGRIASGEEVKFLTNDVEHDPRVHDHAWAKSLGLVAFAGYRLKPHDGDVLGVFALFAKFPISPDMDAILEGLSRAISLAIQKDLTDQILKESEMRLNEVSEMAHVGGWEYDLSTKEVRWTKETYRIHEVPEGTGFNLASATLFYDMPGRSALETSLQQCMEHAEPFDLELPFTSAGGKHLWTRVMGQAVKTDGRIVKLMGTFQNITERKQSDEALRESRQLFADIISFLPDPTFVIDKEGLVLAWNLALEQLSGVPAKEIIGKGNYEYSIWLYGKRRPVLIDLVLKPDQDAARQNYTDIHWEASTVTAQTVFIPSVTGRKTPLSLVASPLIDSQGNTTGAIESMRDISHVKEAETALALLNANLELIVKERTQKLQDEVVQRMQAEKDVKAALDYTRSVIEANPDLVVVLDEAGVILDVNGAGETLTGIPTQQLIGTPYFGYLIEDGTVQSAFAGLLEEGTIENFVRIRRTDGHITPLSVHATVIRGKDGTKDQIIVSAHDITRQKLDEEAIRASLDEKVLLLREVHHRVKNNLQIIISLVNLQMRQTDDPEVKQIMSETQNRVRAMSLVHEKLYRSESLSRIDFADYTRFLATQLFSFYGVDSRRVNLDLTMSRIMVDINTAVPLGLLMNELISNALKHAFPQGREGTIKISGGEKGDLITLAVQDNGVGMAADLDWKNTTSLGMRLITSLTDQVDGVIELDRENGTTFIITIPQKQHPASS